MVEAKHAPLDGCLRYIPEIREFTDKLPRFERDKTAEIRIRAGKPVVLETPGRRIITDVVISTERLDNLVKLFCENSVHSYARQLSECFVTLSGGHRVGIAATAVFRDGKLEGVRGVTSVNIRVAKEYRGSAADVFRALGTEVGGILFIGKPMSGKTTVLRDYVRSAAEFKKIAVIDERGEISGKGEGTLYFDLGQNTDVLDSFPKEAGFIRALRALSPDFVACDELGFDTEMLERCSGQGVGLFLTAHCPDIETASKSEALRRAVYAGGITHIVSLDCGFDIGKVKGIYKVR
ncbi:MAG: hypothetical protein LBN40_02620 [Oscillospiraceae bacterium]|jgi:stage III sporulation protein AA|nr:hypothetical protein [Oscillospiraceae bacterium]